MINKKLAADRNLSDATILEIEALHRERYYLHKLMTNCDEKVLVSLDKECDTIEYKLQDLWGFTRDPTYFKYWRRPRCVCPILDNEDRYPTEHCVIASDCPLHGTAREHSF